MTSMYTLNVEKHSAGEILVTGTLFGADVHFRVTPALLLKAGLFAGFIAFLVFGTTSGEGGARYLPVEEWAERIIGWLDVHLAFLFDIIAAVIEGVMRPIRFVLVNTPPFLLGGLFGVLGFVLHGWRRALFIVTALVVIALMHLWTPTMMTLSLTATATFFAVLVGIPLGIIKAHIEWMSSAMDPILDFMQTMPLFVYLIPAVLFFQIGDVPGIVATFIFATPPAVRLTSLGIEQIPAELVEAGRAFGVSTKQFLWRVELPLAAPSIMMGVNQAIMLALSMVVIAALIGAQGLGEIVVSSVQRVEVGKGLESGLAVVLLAMVLDRLTRRTT